VKASLFEIFQSSNSRVFCEKSVPRGATGTPPLFDFLLFRSRRTAPSGLKKLPKSRSPKKYAAEKSQAWQESPKQIRMMRMAHADDSVLLVG
jgi:hypothetical protein